MLCTARDRDHCRGVRVLSVVPALYSVSYPVSLLLVLLKHFFLLTGALLTAGTTRAIIFCPPLSPCSWGGYRVQRFRDHADPFENQHYRRQTEYQSDHRVSVENSEVIDHHNLLILLDFCSLYRLLICNDQFKHTLDINRVLKCEGGQPRIPGRNKAAHPPSRVSVIYAAETRATSLNPAFLRERKKV